METIVEINISKMKADIKENAEKQKFYRNQRKTEKLVGERQMPAWEATYSHQKNRRNLRIMYAAYGLAKGKNFSQIENHYPEENHPLNELRYEIDKMMNEYKAKDGE
ncbi:MAG: hypothetical protein WC333_01830 [Dehalococcoidia bacterium]|jgi:hypothetical protein